MIKALWGMAGSLEESFEKTFQAGYEGIEAKPPDPEYEQQFKKLLKLYKFDYVAQLSVFDHWHRRKIPVLYFLRYREEEFNKKAPNRQMGISIQVDSELIVHYYSTGSQAVLFKSGFTRTSL